MNSVFCFCFLFIFLTIQFLSDQLSHIYWTCIRQICTAGGTVAGDDWSIWNWFFLILPGAFPWRPLLCVVLCTELIRWMHVASGTAGRANFVHCTAFSFCYVKLVKPAHTQLPSVGFRSWSRFLAVSLQVTWVINPTVGCHYFPPGLHLPPQPLRGLLTVLLLGEQSYCGCEQFA